MAKSDDKGPALALSSGLGRTALVFDEKDIVGLLRIAIEREGSQTAFANRHGINRAIISSILNGRRRISASLVGALGLRRVYVAK